MKIVRQLLRRPTKFIAGLLVISIAVAVLSVCLGQAIAADKTEATMERHFTTIALMTHAHRYEEREVALPNGEVIKYSSFVEQVPSEIVNLIDTITKERPDLVQTVANHGLASAYIPALTPDNYCNYQYQNPLTGSTEGRTPHKQQTDSPYADAMLEITVDSIEITFHSIENGVKEDGTAVSLELGVSATVTGKIESVLSLESSWESPIGKTAILSLEMPTMEDFENLNLEVGGRYIVSGTNYEDGKWKLQGDIARELSYKGVVADSQEVDINRIRYLEYPGDPVFETHIPMVGIYEHYETSHPDYQKGLVPLTQQDMLLCNAITMDVKDRFTDGEYAYIRHESGGYPTMDYTRYLTDENGNKLQITEEEYLERYQVPLIARLDGTVEAFLTSKEGALWQGQLECMQINYRTYPIIGVEKLGYIADFSRENARIVAGRDFTAEELANGAKVCILSETLAAANGLDLGDTIHPQFYNYDHDDPNQAFLSDGVGVIDPWAYRYTKNTQWAGTEEYTIVGLYRQNNAWGDVSENLYSFTPDTIFVPRSSVASDMDYANQGFFQTLVLQNGAVEAFRALFDDAGYEGLFVYYDQEYTTVVDTLMNYREVAQKAMIVGMVVYAVILLLFLLLFPGSQGKTLTVMTALGAKRGQKIWQVWIGSVGILLPGSLIGAVLGMLLWETVISRLAGSIGESVTLEMEPSVLLGIAAAQLALALLLTLLLALPMSRNRGISKRK